MTFLGSDVQLYTVFWFERYWCDRRVVTTSFCWLSYSAEGWLERYWCDRRVATTFFCSLSYSAEGWHGSVVAVTVWSRESTRPLFEIYVCAEKGVAFRPCIHYRTSFSMPRTSKGSRTSTWMGCRYNLSFIHSRSSCSSSSSSSRGSTIFKSSMTSGSLTVIVFFGTVSRGIRSIKEHSILQQ